MAMVWQRQLQLGKQLLRESIGTRPQGGRPSGVPCGVRVAAEVFHEEFFLEAPLP
ncbi:MAG: hypothetical protein GY696_12680 [Gammaproteobacteria bacterium]|nr:hypothetical protein [Gammaproteobacteria bacterium]